MYQIALARVRLAGGMDALPDEVQEHIVGFVGPSGRDWLALRLVDTRFTSHVERLLRRAHEACLISLFDSLYIRRTTESGTVPLRLILRHQFGRCLTRVLRAMLPDSLRRLREARVQATTEGDPCSLRADDRGGVRVYCDFFLYC